MALDEDLMKKMGKASGCKMVRHGKGELISLRMEYGSPAFQIWKDHYLPGGKEPLCLDDSDPMFTPVPATGLVPDVPPHLHAGVTTEVLATVEAYAPLRRHNFMPGAPLPHVTLVPPPIFAGLGVKYHHATMTCFKVFERIQKGLLLPSITACPHGTALTHIQVLYSNCGLSILVTKHGDPPTQEAPV